MFIRQFGEMIGTMVAVLIALLTLRLTLYPHQAKGLLQVALWLRDLDLSFLTVLGLYVGNILLMLRFGRVELSRREMAIWREIITSRLDGRPPLLSSSDLIDHAARLKIASQRYFFRKGV